MEFLILGYINNIDKLNLNKTVLPAGRCSLVINNRFTVHKAELTLRGDDFDSEGRTKTLSELFVSLPFSDGDHIN